jgi:ribosomal protein S1
MTAEILEKYNSKEIKSGESLTVYIKAIDKSKRIHLSLFSEEARKTLEIEESLEDIIEENLEGRVFLSEIKQIKPFGALVKIEPIEQWCLLSQKEITKNKSKLKIGDKIYLTVDSVNTENGKIFMKFMK